MRVPLAWLLSHCDPGLSPGALAERLVLTGTEVERIEHVGVGSPAAFVVGKVLDAVPHPNADRLRVCTVDDGEGEPRTIVCGAPNVAGGQTVAVARPGAVMPGGETLGEADLRGVRSSGMILAEDEVGVGEDHGGIMVLADGLPAGLPLVEVLPVSDEVLELEITPNRPDCLGVYGVARELHAATGATLGADPTDLDPEPRGTDHAEAHLAVEIDPGVCLRFTARVFEDVRIGPSPLWLKARLTAAGQRPISNVVDITNYVMLETGQPLHAFDLDRVRGGRLEVRSAGEGELLRTLDGSEHRLEAGMAVIADDGGPTSLAGIMGGEVSEVIADTTRVAMEAATWVGTNILRTSSRLGLRSEASGRFEKQLHPAQAEAAQRLAARLMTELCGARLVPGTIDVHPQPSPARVVGLRLARLEGLLGAPLEEDEVRAILGRLGFTVADGREPGALAVTVPPFRDADVQREADLIEEVARVHGLERLPATLPARREAVGRLSPAQRLRRRAEDALADRGLHEIVAYATTSPDVLARLRLGDLPTLSVANPMSVDASVLRPLLLPALLDAARHNVAHGQGAVRLFESAHVYRPLASPPAPGAGSPRGARPADERHHLGAVVTEAAPGGWRTPARAADLFALKGVLEGLLDGLGLAARFEPDERPYLHPGRTAAVLAGDRALGWLGELHPLVARAWDLPALTAFELDLDLLAELAPGPARFRDLTSFPPVRQDLAVIVDEGVPAAAVEAAVREGGGALLDEVAVFDVFRGDPVPPGQVSIALRLAFRAPDRTLTDDEVTGLRSGIERRLADLGGRLRG